MAIDRRGIATQGYRTTVERTRLRIATEGYRGDEVGPPVGDGTIRAQAIVRSALVAVERAVASAAALVAQAVPCPAGAALIETSGAARGTARPHTRHTVNRARAVPQTPEE